MKSYPQFSFRLSHLVVAAIVAGPLCAAPVSKPIAGGVTLYQDINTNPSCALVTTAVRINLKSPGVKVAAALGQDGVIETDATKGRETISKLVGRKGAVAGINADFFPYTGDPLGLSIVNGELVSEPMGRAAVGITAAGDAIFDRVSFAGTIKTSCGVSYPLKGVNRPRGKNEIVLYRPVFGATTGTKDGIEIAVTLDGPVRPNADIVATVTSDPVAGGGMAIPADGAVISAGGPTGDWLFANIHKGDKITLNLQLKSATGRNWDNVTEAVGGGPWLVRNGAVYIDGDVENFKPDILNGKNPRTAVGVTKTGELLMVTVDGRQSISKGVRLSELAGVMKSLGAVDAINLDGGGSTTLSAKGVVVNSPSGGDERAVANGLVVYANALDVPKTTIQFVDVNPIQAVPGRGRMVAVVDADGKLLKGEVASKLVWGTTGGIGFVNQQGYFTPIKTGAGSVVAILGDQKIALPVTVDAAKPATITATIAADSEAGANQGLVTATVLDQTGAPVQGVTVNISVVGGTSSVESLMTDEKGTATFHLTWDTCAADAVVTVTTGGLSTTAK